MCFVPLAINTPSAHIPTYTGNTDTGTEAAVFSASHLEVIFSPTFQIDESNV